jgi:hypothetical protein
MIEFKEIKGSSITAGDDRMELPSKEEVELFFENFFKQNVDLFSIYKSNKFKNPNKDIVSDFCDKFANFVKNQNKDETLNEFIDIVFKNIFLNIKLLENRQCLPSNDKSLSFFTSFIISKFFS